MTCPAPGCIEIKGHGVHHSDGTKTWRDLRPTSGKAEFMLTYACDLECAACNQASFLKKPHTESMTLDDAHEFCRQARALDWFPRIILKGGEPTLHPDFEEFVKIAAEFSGRPAELWSNAYRPKARELIKLARDKHRVSICTDTQKPAGSVTGPPADGSWWSMDVFVSPTDMGMPPRDACFQSSSVICGISVDHDGYAPCALGGAIDALLHVGGRSKVLADLFDKDKVAVMQEALCRHCGQQWVERQPGMVESCEKRFNTPMSKTWIAAFEGRR